MGKLSVLTAGAVGYVLGARAGRERYEQIAAQAQRLWRDPRVQEQVSNATETVKAKAPEVASSVASAATHAASAAATAAASKVTGGSDSDSPDDEPPRDEMGRFTSDGG